MVQVKTKEPRTPTRHVLDLSEAVDKSTLPQAAGAGFTQAEATLREILELQRPQPPHPKSRPGGPGARSPITSGRPRGAAPWPSSQQGPSPARIPRTTPSSQQSTMSLAS